MANTRTTFGRRSRQPGDQVGVQMNVFGLNALQAGITGDKLAEVLLYAGQPAYEEAHADWAVDTGASRDSIELVVAEVLPRAARVVLQAGGSKLIDDPRNKAKKDYAPFLEFNGSPSGSMGPGTIQRAVYSNDRVIKERIKEGVAKLIAEALA